MIQRIQTIYYLIGLLILTTGLFSPIVFNDEASVQLDLFWLKYGVYGSVFCIVGLFVTILKFKPLKRQLLLGRICLFTSLLISLLNLYTVVTGLNSSVHISWSFYLLFLSPIAIFLGNRGVKKDIQLLNSLNRLR